ncbi:speckle targeted PIP5K1A-regulated poly(A) polymerase-like isoform X2 [Epargyreus clarus]
MRMSKPELENLEIAMKDIQETLNKLWKGCVVKPFGSVVTKLALKSSDLDCIVDVRPPEDPIQCVEKAFHFLSNTETQFQVVSKKTHTKVPCMRIFHKGMNKYCDISFSSPIAVEVASLFAYLLDIDKTRSLALLLKYWSKVHKIAGTQLLPNSALTILLIVFLQRENILPPIAMLQKNVPPVMMDGWNVAFERINYESNTTKSIYQLLGEFFEFYSEFKFVNLLISPYLGGFVDRKCFSNINTVPPEFELYEERNATGDRGTIAVQGCIVCVQCPFDHSRNIAIAVKPPLAHRIIQCFREAAASYRKYPKHDFLKSILNVYESNNTRQFNQGAGRMRGGRRGRLPQKARKDRRSGYIV